LYSRETELAKITTAPKTFPCSQSSMYGPAAVYSCSNQHTTNVPSHKTLTWGGIQTHSNKGKKVSEGEELEF